MSFLKEEVLGKQSYQEERRSSSTSADIFLGTSLTLTLLLLLHPTGRQIFVHLSHSHPYMMAFVKFAILATIGELFAKRITHGKWQQLTGLIWRAIIWGFLGIIIALIFNIYSFGVATVLQKGLLPFGGNGYIGKIAFAFFTSLLMNAFFAPTFMAFHRITDTYIETGKGQLSNMLKIPLSEVLDHIDWKGFISFIVCRTIPCFWIPAHTITFLLPPEYRVLVAALLSIALGAILGYSTKISHQNS